jgi:hypothetical protein
MAMMLKMLPKIKATPKASGTAIMLAKKPRRASTPAIRIFLTVVLLLTSFTVSLTFFLKQD